jgi:hypothetical protein
MPKTRDGDLVRWRDLYEIGEEDRQMILLALGRLAVDRPGWDSTLGRLAETLDGAEMYRTFRDLAKEEKGG